MNVQGSRIADVAIWSLIPFFGGMVAAHIFQHHNDRHQFTSGYAAGYSDGMKAGVAEGRDTLVCWGIKHDRVTPIPERGGAR